MVTRSYVTALAVFFLALTACTGKTSKRTIHEGPIPTAPDYAMVTPAEANNVVVAAYNARGETSARINAAASAQDLLAIALELEKIVLNPSILSAPNMSGRTEFDSVLSLFHRALDKAMDKNLQAVVDSGILTRYENAALAHCTQQNTGCIRLAIFKGDHLASRILMRIAGTLEASLIQAREKRDEIVKRLADSNTSQASDVTALQTQESKYLGIVVHYYRLLMLSYELNNGQPSPELDQKYVTFARDYFEYFRKLPPEQKKHDFHRRHRDVLTLALGHLKNQTQAGSVNEAYCAFLTKLNPLDPEMFASFDLDSRQQRTMVGEFIECTSRKGQLKGLIAEFVRTQNERAAANYKVDKLSTETRVKVKDDGYAYSRAALEEVPFLYQNLDVKLTPRTDLAYFILDRVYYRQMDLNVAQSYWARVTGLDDLEFLRFARNYARLQAAYVLKVTLQNYGRIFADQFKAKGGLTSDFFYEVVKETNAVSQFDWDELNDRLLFTREFIVKVYDARYGRTVGQGRPAEIQKEFLGLKEELGDLQRHFAMAVTTPMSVPLYYYMAKAQGTIKFFVPWMPSSDQWVDIPAADALSRFLRYSGATTYPFFKFASIRENYDVYQKMHVLNFAFRIGIFHFVDFAMLDEDKASGLPAEVLFFKQLAKDLLSIHESSFNNRIQELETKTRDRNFSQYFLGACEDPLGAAMTLDLNKFPMATLLGDPALTDAASAIYTSTSFVNAWRMNRENVMQLIRVYEDHKAFSGAATDPIVAQVKDTVERFDALERRLYSLTFQLDRQVVNTERDCLARLHRAEFLRRNELMAGNVEYYKDVHAAMSVVNILNGQELNADATTIRNAYQTAAQGRLDADVRFRANRLIDLVSTTGLLAKMSLADALNEVLKIHNLESAPYEQIGYYVTGLPTFEDGGKRVKSLNYFTHERFYQGQWDSLIRNRRMMQTRTVDAGQVNAILGTKYSGTRVPLAPNVSIPLGGFGELELNSLYTNNRTKNIGYTDDQKEFLKSAMIQFDGLDGGTQFFSWFTPGGLSIALSELRLNFLRDVQELGVIQTSDQDQKVCPQDMWKRPMAVKDVQGNWLPGVARIEECKAIRASSSDVMEAYLDTIDLLRVTPQEREFIEMMNLKGKLETKIEKLFRYNNELSTTKWTYFDQFYRANYTTVSSTTADGAAWKTVYLEDIRGRGEFQSFKDSFQRNFKDVPTLFPLRDGPTQLNRNFIREKILNHLDEIMTFEESVYALENRKDRLGDFLYEITTTPRSEEPLVDGKWRVIKVEERKSGDRAGTPIYLSEENSAKSWFAGYLETFVIKDTDCTVLPQAGDPDFTAAITETDCRARFNKWKDQRESVRQEIRASLKGTDEV